MKLASPSRRTLALLALLALLTATFLFVAFRSGPLAPVPVTVTTVESHAIHPARFGLGTVAAQYTFKIGPTTAGRVLRVDVDVGDRVRAGQTLGEMDPVDLESRIAAQDAALRRARAGIEAAAAQVQDHQARHRHAETQHARYEALLRTGSISEEAGETKQQELQVAAAALSASRANLEVAKQETARLEAEREVLLRQRQNLRLAAPRDGLVSARRADPGTTVVAGESVIEVIDPTRLWLEVRFDQLHSAGLRPGLPARITLRSQPDIALAGHVLRVEPVADAVTEETLAKVVFATTPDVLPPLGELAEVTVALPPLAAAPVVPNASVQRVNGQLGVWAIEDDDLRFAPIVAGAADLDGNVQVLSGLAPGARIVVYSQRSLGEHTRIAPVARLRGDSR